MLGPEESAIHPTYQALLKAGYSIAKKQGLKGLSVNTVVAEAGVAKGTFYVHFPTRDDYLVALHRSLNMILKEKLVQETAGIPPGLDWLRAAATAYLDGCLQLEGAKTLLYDARSEPVIDAEIRKGGAEMSLIAKACFEAMGWPGPQYCATLFVMMIADAALVEVRKESADPDLRAALLRFLGS